MMANKYICLVFLVVHLQTMSFAEDACRKCSLSRTHGMKSVDCYNKDMREFPKCIPTDSEVLELSYNRIRKVTRSDLSQLSYIKFLYLKDNMLVTLQNDTFADMSSLLALDLSQNNIDVVPTSVFKLPSLKKLYLSQNYELDMSKSVKDIIPILSPIETFDIGETTADLAFSVFPYFGTMPYLLSLNISENKYQVLTPKHFAGLCSLKILININVSNNYIDSCDCWIINKWLMSRKVEFKEFVCPVSENDCQNKEVNEEDMQVYNECLEIVDAIEKQHRVQKLSIGLGVSFSIIIVIALIVLYYYFRRSKRRNNASNSNKINDSLASQTDGPLLLNNHTKNSDNL